MPGLDLIIDIGNTFTKIFVFELNKLVHTEQHKNLNSRNLENILKTFPAIQNIIISSVDDTKKIVLEPTDFHIDTLIYLSHRTKLPIKNRYKNPETLGNDRIAAAVGAYNIYPGQNVLAIDAGTAITFELVKANGEYLGGNISPGLKMRFKALNKYTSKLPLMEPVDDYDFLGRDTQSAIIAGVQNGMIFEIDSYIDNLKAKFDDLKVILCGGDTFFFAHKLKNRIFAEPYLVAFGLNRILQENVKTI